MSERMRILAGALGIIAMADALNRFERGAAENAARQKEPEPAKEELPEPPPAQPMTRQQRRYLARQAAKRKP